MILTAGGRRLYIHDREEWQVPSRPVSGPRADPNAVHHAVIHWPGASLTWKPPMTTQETAAHLRWSQDMYLVDRGYSYGYGFVVGATPINWDADPIVTDIWEVRGIDIRIASNNGDRGEYAVGNFNARSISLQIPSSVKYPATADQILQARYWVTAMDGVYGETLKVIPHRESDLTTCPGEYIMARMDEIARRVSTAPPKPPPVPPPPTPHIPVQEDTMLRAAKLKTNGSFWLGDGNKRWWAPGDHEGKLLTAPGVVDAKTATVVHSWAHVNAVDEAFLNEYVGRP